MSTTPLEQQQTPPAPPPPQTSVLPRPDGVSDAEWAALGDPGKAAIVRERAARSQAEQALAIARAAVPGAANDPAAPWERTTTTTRPAATPAPPKHAAEKTDESPDIAALIQEAVTAALAPMQAATAQRDAEQAAAVIADAVTTAAADRFHDPADALAGITLSTLTDGTGKADPAKVTAAITDLLTRKPHLGKPVDPRRQAVPGGLVGAGTTVGPAALEDRVKKQLDLMNQQH